MTRSIARTSGKCAITFAAVKTYVLIGRNSIMLTRILSQRLSLAVAFLVPFVSFPAFGATFFASASGCGPNSIWQAIQDSNTNPGVDTIEISAGAQFGEDSLRCDGSFLGDEFIGTFTDSAVVNGNGAKIVARNTWVTAGAGIIIPANRRDCPVIGDAGVSRAGRVFEVGEFGVDNSGITVTVDDFSADGPGGLFAVRSGAELEVSNSRYDNIWNAWGPSDCDTHAVVVESNATFTARNTQFVDTFSTLNQIHFASTPAASTISAFGSGSSINLERVRIEQGLAGYAVSNTGGTTNIVSSTFNQSGGIYNGRGSKMNIVNTAWSGRFGAFSGQTDQIHNQGTMSIEASTFWVPDTQNCESASSNPPNLCPSNAAPLLNDGGSMELKGTAVGTDLSQIQPNGDSTPVTTGTIVVNGGDTWIGPTRGGSLPFPGTAEWINIFVEPDPDTGSPGLNGIMPVINVLGDGVLIDRIECSTNALINPIDNTSIDTDVLGNPRCDGSGRRNIGAVQTQTAPHLVVNRAGDGRVELAWIAPANCPAPESIGGYNLYRRLVGGSFGAAIVINGASTLSFDDIGVINGEQYEYEIKARCGFVDGGGGFTDISESARSNLATATPIGQLGIAQPTAVTAGDGSVQVFWAAPTTLGGYKGLLSYGVVYRPVGAQTWINGPQGVTARNITLLGLTNGTAYEFGVAAQTDDGGLSPTLGIMIGTPQAAPTLSYANPPSWPQNTPLTLTPTVTQLQGSGTYSIESGALPAGLVLDASTGAIFGTPTTQQSTSATIRVTDTATGLFTDVTVPLSIVAPLSSPQLWYPSIQATVGVGPVSATPTQSGIPAGAVWSVLSGDNLPAGFTLDSATGVISGTPTTAPRQVVDITIQACWGGCNPSAGEVRLATILFWIIPNLQYPANTQATAGVATTVTPTVSLWSGGVFSIESGSLPAGMSLDPVTGVISGTPQTALNASVTVRYSTGVNVLVPPLDYVHSATQISVAPPTITLTYPAVTASLGNSLSVSPTVTGLNGTAIYSTFSGALPQGLSLDTATGVISGVPTGTPGSYPVVIQVTGPYGSQRTDVVIEIEAPPAPVPALAPSALALLAILMMLIAGGARLR
ncbi:putative Ig domain-containing protein [Luminiphilus sp.]|nr:putative Ig domain-containing protein [Luminiphilus sp.]